MLLTKKNRTDELWLTNEPDIAATYGPVILAVDVPDGATMEAYPLRTGQVEDMPNPFSEPAEFLMLYDGDITCRLYAGTVEEQKVVSSGKGKNRERLEFQLKINALPICPPASLVKPLAEDILNSYDDGPLCGVEFDELMAQLYAANEDVISSMGYDYND